jgi:DDE superfamily endonuclease
MSRPHHIRSPPQLIFGTATWTMERAKRARTAETPKQPSLCLRLRAPYFYPDYPEAERVRVVLTTSQHIPSVPRTRPSACEAHRGLRRLELHFVPKHASWLNTVELEIGVLRSQCLDRRIGERERLEAEIAA